MSASTTVMGHFRAVLTQGQLVALIDLPEMPCLSVESHDFLHSFDFGFLPFLGRHGSRFWKDEHAGFNLELMRVPVLVSLAAANTRKFVYPTRVSVPRHRASHRHVLGP